MLIDWFTVAAQILNFLILAWLLRHFLYRPIVTAIDTREKRIAADIADAVARKSTAQKEHDDLVAKTQVFDAQRGALLATAQAEAQAEGARLLADARKAADGERLRQNRALHDDLDRLGDAIGQAAKVEVFAIARKTLADLADAALEERIAASFDKRLRGIDGKAKELLATALKSAAEPAILRSTFELSAPAKGAIQKSLDETFAAPVRVRFETAAQAVCGIELTANGQKFAWSIDAYLKRLQDSVGEVLDRQGAYSEPAPPASPPAPAAPRSPATAPVAADPRAHAAAK